MSLQYQKIFLWINFLNTQWQCTFFYHFIYWLTRYILLSLNLMKTAKTIQNIKVCLYDLYPSNMPYWPNQIPKYTNVTFTSPIWWLVLDQYLTSQYHILDWLVSKDIIFWLGPIWLASDQYYSIIIKILHNYYIINWLLQYLPR